MKQVNLYEAKTHLSRLVEDAERGEEIVLARNGKPVAKIVALHESKPSDWFGMDRGLFTVPDDFDQTPEDFADYL